MPKVSDEYTESKKEFILHCVEEVYQEKPLYQITMRDVIKKTGYSQGAIYRYYKNLDDIYLDLINRSTTGIRLEHEIDALVSSGLNEAETIAKCIVAIGNYIQELLKSSTGMMYFGLLVIYAHDARKRESILPRLTLKKAIAYAQQKTVGYLIQCVQAGVLQPIISVDALISYTCAAIDGISIDAMLSMAGQSGENPVSKIDVSQLFEALAKSIVMFLGQPEGVEP